MEAIKVERVQDAVVVNGGQIDGMRAWFAPFSAPGVEVTFGETTVTMTREVACNLAAALTEYARDG